MKKHRFTVFTLTVCILVVANAEASERFRILALGSTLNGPNGIIFDSNDRLHVASVVGREISIMDSQRGLVVERLGPEQGIEGPDDLTFGPDGSLYWTSFLTGMVGRLDTTGAVKTQFVGPGVNPITFSDDGRLFVALASLGDALYELDPALESPPRLLADNIGGLNGMDFGPDSYLYAPIPDQGRVVRIDVDAEPITIDTIADNITRPVAVKFDSLGRLHAVDTVTGQVMRVDVQTGSVELLATLGEGLDNLALDSRDHLYVSNVVDGYIARIHANGRARIINRSGFVQPGGIAVVPEMHSGKSVFIADVYSLVKLDGSSGRVENVYSGTFGIAYPLTVAPHGDDLVLTSWFSNTVQIFDPENEQIVSSYNNFATPLNAIDFQGTLIVAELGSSAGAARVLQVSQGETITLADFSNNIYVPIGLAATENNLWVGDWATGMIWQISGPGNLVPIAAGLASPEGLAVDKEGNLLVVEAGAKRLTRIDLLTGETSVVKDNLALGAEGVPGMPPTWTLNGVAVDEDGTIYVTGDKQNVIYRTVGFSH